MNRNLHGVFSIARARVMLAALALLAGVLLATPAASQVVGWAWVVPAGEGQTFTPLSHYQYLTNGQTITVARGIGNNEFIVTFPNAAPNVGGCVHASPVSGNHTTVVKSWLTSSGDVVASVLLFDAAGQPANDEQFTIHWRYEGPNSRREAYCWANNATAAVYTPSAAYAWNGNRGAPTIQRLSTGRYRVKFPGLSNFLPGGERGHVQVTPHGSAPVWATVAQWSHAGSDVNVEVRTFDALGQPTDNRFVVSYNEAAAPLAADDGSGAHVWAHLATQTNYTPSASYTDSNGRFGPPDDETVRRISTGFYRVNLPNVDPGKSSTVQVTAFGTSPRYASVGGWLGDGCGGTNVVVRVHDQSGNLVDGQFNLLYLSSRPASKPSIGWAFINPAGQGTTFTPDPTYSYSSAGQPITVTRGNFAHEYTITFEGLAPRPGGVPIVAPLNGSHAVIVRHIDTVSTPDVTVFVDTWGPNGLPAPNAPFTILWRQGGESGTRRAYAFSTQPTSPSTPMHPIYHWNDGRGAVVNRISQGNYQAVFYGLAPQGAERGNVQVSAYGAGLKRAKVVSWGASGPDLVVNVQTRDITGALEDHEFIVSYTETAAPIPREDGSGAHVWANFPTLQNYTPHAAYTDSNGTLGPTGGPSGGEEIFRLGTGSYQVWLPDLKGSDSSIAIVTGHGNDDTFASIDSWWAGPSGGTGVVVRTMDAAGSLTDARFTLLYLTDEPAVTVAENSTFGSGCNGLTLVPRTRPVLCRKWELSLTGVPANAALGFVQVDLVSTQFTLGPNAPGCVLHTGGAATVLLLMPLPDPAYSLTIPSDPSFIGLPIYAQGGAFVPNVNPYSLALSAPVLGTVGDY